MYYIYNIEYFIIWTQRNRRICKLWFTTLCSISYLCTDLIWNVPNYIGSIKNGPYIQVTWQCTWQVTWLCTQLTWASVNSLLPIISPTTLSPSPIKTLLDVSTARESSTIDKLASNSWKGSTRISTDGDGDTGINTKWENTIIITLCSKSVIIQIEGLRTTKSKITWTVF